MNKRVQVVVYEESDDIEVKKYNKSVIDEKNRVNDTPVTKFYKEIKDYAKSDLTGFKKHQFLMSKLGVNVTLNYRKPIKMLNGIRKERRITKKKEKRSAKKADIILPTKIKRKRTGKEKQHEMVSMYNKKVKK